MAERDGVAGPAFVARLGNGVAGIDPAAWDALDPTGHPFTRHRFLSLLETSASADPRTGWQPVPITIAANAGQADGAAPRAGPIIAAAPAYLKAHSQGEYVFDHAWADAYGRAGGDYYPKLLIAVPFTPVPGPRLLTGTASAAAPELTGALIGAAEAVVAQHGLSSAHATFVAPDQLGAFADAGWLIRADCQFHWTNRGYADFDDFLGTLSSAKRKAVRRERRIAADGVRLRSVTGDAICPADWDAMWAFYQDTGARKWGRPYLTRAAFGMMADTMADAILLTLADDAETGRTIAGALHVIGPDRLYGRYWGTIADRPMLHFELCYYQAIDFAIECGLAVVEAGAQGAHKLARGYGPALTWSAHHLPDPGFRRAVARFLAAERAAVDQEVAALIDHSPYRRVAGGPD